MKFKQFLNPEVHGMAAYDAYCAELKLALGRNHPTWRQLSPIEQQAWISAASKVVLSLLADVNSVLTLIVENGKEVVDG